MASYRVEVSDPARSEIRRLPGNMRQRVIRALRALEGEARPSSSQALDMEDLATEPAAGMELRRIQTASWRIVYVVEEADERITVLAVRKRPPYQYDDLDELLGNL